MGQLILVSFVMVSRAVLGQAEAGPDPQSKLDAAIQAFDSLNDERARPLLNELLKAGADEHITAKAYLYLGLIDFNALDTGHAQEEFQRAIELDPALELPRESSPKVQLAFAEARNSLAKRLGKAPDPSVSVEGRPETPAAKGSHILGWSLVGGAAASGVVALIGLGYVVDYNSTVNAANTQPGSVSGQVIRNKQGPANTGVILGWAGASVCAALVTGAIITW